MKLFAGATVTLMLVLVPCQTVLAQSAAMPLPGLVLKDADGKVMAQVIDLGTDADTYTIRVVFHFLNRPVAFEVLGPHGIFRSTGQIVFTGPTCTGNAYTKTVVHAELGEWVRQRFIIIGPDRQTGTYRLFRVTSTAWESIVPISYWEADGECQDWSSGGMNGYPVGEFLPNPLAGFHGPTDTQPERVLTLSGGDKLP